MAEDISIIFITLVSFIALATGESNNVDGESSKTCALLFNEENLDGGRFTFPDGSQVTNFEEEYISSADVWNSTLSFSVEASCLLTACNDTHFDGDCREFPSTMNKLPDGFDNFLSANCTCHKECSCSDIYMRKTSCARAYFDGGCNVCNPYYTDLKGSKTFFSADFSERISAIKVRDGCNLTIYDEEDFNGEETSFQGTVEDWKDTIIGSYDCTCSPESFAPKPKPPRPENYPPLINIPSTINEVSSMMKGDLAMHPGLLAALSSLRNQRSSKNVYILAIGSTGAGKSSAINLLFDNPNVTRVGEGESTTSNIHEFRIPIPVDKLGIANSELRVIDTPGLGDTRGLEQDAKFLATLDEYLLNHEELHNRMPNVVLIFHKFHDNRYAGEGSTFVKMLRGLDEFRTRITDENYSNVVFVLSHFMFATKAIRKKPKSRLLHFKNVIEDYSQFPKPVVITVAENKAEEQELPMVNGYFKLPNGDFYPRNLFDKIQLATSSGGDLIGDAVIRTGFRDADNFNITPHTFQLVDSNNNKVTKYLGILSGANYNVNNTEISQILAKTYETLDLELKQKFPDALLYLQKALNIRNVRTAADIPKTTIDILKLLSSIKQNEAILYLLENALELKPPIFQQNVVTGYSYNVFKDIPLTKSPFKLGDFKNSDIGYLFPSVMTCGVEHKVKDFFENKENLAEYIQERISSLGIEGGIPEEKFSGLIKPGFNIKTESYKNDTCWITAVREIRMFELVLNDKPQLTEEFIKILESLPVFNETDHDNVNIWTNFFDEYGTHVVKHVHGGGAIEIDLKSDRVCDSDIANALFHLIQFAEDLTILDSNSNTSLIGEGIQHRLTFRGGDQAYHTPDLTKMTLDEASSLLKNWKSSLRINPTILTTEMRLLPLSEVAKKVGQKQNISSEIERATSLLFNSSLIYIPPSKTIARPGDRQSVDVNDNSQGFNSLIQTLLLDSKESKERFEKLMIKIQEDQVAAEIRRDAAHKEHMKWLSEQEVLREKEAALAKEERDEREKVRLAEQKKYFEDIKRTEAELSRVNAQAAIDRALASAKEAHDRQMQDLRDKANADRIRGLEREVNKSWWQKLFG